MQFEDATQQMHKDVRRRVEACMETGNFDQARTILVEYEDVWPAEGRQLRHDLVPSYGTSL